MLEPLSIAELLERTKNIEGMTIEQLANILGITMPLDLKYAKGFIGQLIEIALGATGNSNPVHDFPAIGVELKTIPITCDGKPAQNTHICILPDITYGQTFENSNFYNKIKKVLWLPVQGDKNIPFPQRYIGEGFIWEPSKTDLAILKNDWTEIMNLIALDSINNVSSKIGTYAMISPGGIINNKKQYSFYFRKKFTHKILLEHFS